MLPCRQILLCSLILIIRFSFGRSNSLATKFNIALKTPDKTASPSTTPHKSVHVKYTLPNDKDQWTIVGFELQIQRHQKAIEQLTVHLCDLIIDRSIWYDDEANCDSPQSMLIYQWTSYSSLAPFRIAADCGFELNKTKSIILTVIYKKEKRIHKEQSGILLSISTLPIRFQMGTMFVGNKHQGTHFSCRSSSFPRLIYGVKRITSHQNKNGWWRIYVIRVRQFGRKLVQLVFDSASISHANQSNIELVGSDLFLMRGDYFLIECENGSERNCYFLIYYNYKSRLIKNDNLCQNNDFANLFKLIPPREILSINQRTRKVSSIDGSTIFLIIFIVLLIIWISIIIGCIIMRRIRGLVNFRPEPVSSSQKNKSSSYDGRNLNEQYNARTGDTDQIMQIDAEHGGA